jgi:hypothetical protein
MMSTVPMFRFDQSELLLSNSSGGYSCIVNELTGEIEKTLPNEHLGKITDGNGLLNDEGLEYFGLYSRKIIGPDGDYLLPGTFHGGALSVIPTGLRFHGGNQLETDFTQAGEHLIDEAIERHELKYLKDVLSEIFDGRHDLADIDKEFLLNPESGMPQTLRSLFINKPGHNGGKSSIRHIFKGDKSGGLHVPAFAPELSDTVGEAQVEPYSPFDAIVSINGVSKLVLNRDSGAPMLEPARTSMFPRELDSLAVMQCVIDAWEHKGDRKSVLVSKDNSLSNIYEVPVMIEGADSPMTIRLVTDAGTVEEKIRTAFPVVAQ